MGRGMDGVATIESRRYGLGGRRGAGDGGEGGWEERPWGLEGGTDLPVMLMVMEYLVDFEIGIPLDRDMYCIGGKEEACTAVCTRAGFEPPYSV